VCQIPLDKNNFATSQIKWNPNGTSFIAEDKTGLVFAYPSPTFFDEENAC